MTAKKSGSNENKMWFTAAGLLGLAFVLSLAAKNKRG